MVHVGGVVADKPGRLVADDEPLRLEPGARFVSRGGGKLDAALSAFGISVEGRRCLDAGVSTGGFTDCLLQRGASEVVAVDVARGQVHPRIGQDQRVTVIEGTNLRRLDLAAVGGMPFDLVVADLSFISLTAVMELLALELARPRADLVLLVKPQFEVGRVVASRGKGVVRDSSERLRALRRVASALGAARATIIGAMPSPLLGPAGNAEFFLHAEARAASVRASREREHAASAAHTAESGPADSERASSADSVDLPETVEAMLEAAVAGAPDSGGERHVPATGAEVRPEASSSER
jgi:23S rRNA (cytidine1920-2'-O)/16S rRNA (cytidine1409-2'-O)-methyltransferase